MSTPSQLAHNAQPYSLVATYRSTSLLPQNLQKLAMFFFATGVAARQ